MLRRERDCWILFWAFLASRCFCFSLFFWSRRCFGGCFWFSFDLWLELEESSDELESDEELLESDDELLESDDELLLLGLLELDEELLELLLSELDELDEELDELDEELDDELENCWMWFSLAVTLLYW
jgi:hypothetical protein